MKKYNLSKIIFQSTLPRREWLLLKKSTKMDKYFNPHSQEGSDVLANDGTYLLPISIHTPKKGVTHILPRSIQVLSISIHTPKKGVTVIGFHDVNPIGISIHTPKKGVTFWLAWLLLRFGNFNPHSQEGSDPVPASAPAHCYNFNPHSQEGSDIFGILIWYAFFLFQSTLPRREWPNSLPLLVLLIDFNPHSQEGSDMDVCPLRHASIISIHTPKKGVTKPMKKFIRCHWGFQSTLPRREWRPGCGAV